jgi:hypothetical protein
MRWEAFQQLIGAIVLLNGEGAIGFISQQHRRAEQRVSGR